MYPMGFVWYRVPRGTLAIKMFIWDNLVSKSKYLDK